MSLFSGKLFFRSWLKPYLSVIKTDIVDEVSQLQGQIDTLRENSVSWFSLVSGYASLETLPPISTGKVLKYTYNGGEIRYRYIATDNSEDSFYKNYSAGVFSELVVKKQIIL